MKYSQAFAICFFLIIASNSFAAVTFTSESITNAGGTTSGSELLDAYTTSTNVTLSADANVALNAYGVAAAHTQGTRVYFSGSEVSTVSFEESATAITPDTIEGIVTAYATQIATADGEIPETITPYTPPAEQTGG